MMEKLQDHEFETLFEHANHNLVCEPENDENVRMIMKCKDCDAILLDFEHENSVVCLECNKLFYCETDIQLCDNCQDKFDLESLWQRHDNNEIDGLDFNKSKKIREKFRKNNNIKKQQGKINKLKNKIMEG